MNKSSADGLTVDLLDLRLALFARQRGFRSLAALGTAARVALSTIYHANAGLRIGDRASKRLAATLRITVEQLLRVIANAHRAPSSS